jgi:hypothetical protein
MGRDGRGWEKARDGLADTTRCVSIDRGTRANLSCPVVLGAGRASRWARSVWREPRGDEKKKGESDSACATF